jgi:transposase InsO family protein
MTINEPFQAITSDISYIPTDEGFEYLCTIKDIQSKVILAEMQSDNMSRALVVETINAAQKRWKLPPGTVFHSDRGSQYTSEEVMTRIASLGWRRSFSRVGRPGDNAWHERFYSILKEEAVYHAHFHTREQARQAVFDFIERFYNRKRIQKSLGYLSPMDALIPRMQLAA